MARIPASPSDIAPAPTEQGAACPVEHAPAIQFFARGAAAQRESAMSGK